MSIAAKDVVPFTQARARLSELADEVKSPLVWAAMVRLVQRVEPVLEQIGRTLPKDFPPRTWDAISRGMRSQAARFLGGLAGLTQ
jgi:serine/threonine-protein kinase HipA